MASHDVEVALPDGERVLFQCQSPDDQEVFGLFLRMLADDPEAFAAVCQAVRDGLSDERREMH